MLQHLPNYTEVAIREFILNNIDASKLDVRILKTFLVMPDQISNHIEPCVPNAVGRFQQLSYAKVAAAEIHYVMESFLRNKAIDPISVNLRELSARSCSRIKLLARTGSPRFSTVDLSRRRRRSDASETVL